MNVALIIARKNSKRIPNKNKKIFSGKPIIYWPIKTVKKSKIFDEIYLSTDDKKIANLGIKYGIKVPFLREKKLGGNKVSTLRVVKEFIKKIEKTKKLNIKNLCCIYASAPFFTIKDIKEGLSKLTKLKSDFLFVSTPINKTILRAFYFKKNKMGLINKKFKNLRSQDLPNCYIDSGQFYWGKKNTWIKKNTIFTSNTTALIRSELSYIDINEKKDWEEAEKAFKKKNIFKLIKFKKKYLKNIYTWRNEKSARDNSLIKNKFSFNEHKIWIKSKSKNKSNRIFIFLKNNIPIGTCSIIKKKSFYYFNYLLKKNSRNKGFSKIMLKKFISNVKKTRIKKKILAVVIKTNKLSYKLLTNSGFELKSMQKEYFVLKLAI